jgi:hypothetical protein
VWVVEPGRDGDSVVRVEDVRGGGVVDDDCLIDGSAELGQVLRGQTNLTRRSVSDSFARAMRDREEGRGREREGLP